MNLTTELQHVSTVNCPYSPSNVGVCEADRTLQLSDEDLAALDAADVTPRLFAALHRIGRIRSDCKVGFLILESKSFSTVNCHC